MSTLSIPPPPPSQQPLPVYYVPVAVDSTTRIAKTLLMGPLVGHMLIGIVYIFVLIGATLGQRYGSPAADIAVGSLVVIAWCAAHVWLFIIAYRSISALRRECLDAKLKSQSVS